MRPWGGKIARIDVCALGTRASSLSAGQRARARDARAGGRHTCMGWV